MRKLKLITGFVCAILFGSNLYGVDWSDFRGPKGNPVHDGELPLNWNTKNNENVAWKSALPGRGVSSPIVVGDLVVVTASSGSCLLYTSPSPRDS